MLATTDNFHARTKHIDIRFHFIRHSMQTRVFKLIYCPTDDMVADILTKALPAWKVKGHSAALGLRSACGGVLKHGTEIPSGSLRTGALMTRRQSGRSDDSG